MSQFNQQELICLSLDELIASEHPYRKILSLVDFEALCAPLQSTYSHLGRKGYAISSGMKALILQWMEDLSDRELERYLRENLAGKYFCDFSIAAGTPDHSYFSELRKRIGTKMIAKLFNTLSSWLEAADYTPDCFTFVDSTALISKQALWKERDKAIACGEEALNNKNIEHYAVDKDARHGCKGKQKYGYGYKNHCSVDMRHGFIKKTAATPANVSDAKGLKHVCPKQGAVIADKAYCTKEAQSTLKRNRCHDGAIKTRNMKCKNKEKDQFLSKLRAPYENVFAKMQKRTRYRGLKKVQYQCLMEAIAFNLKRLVRINGPPLNMSLVG